MHLYALSGVGSRVDNAEGEDELPWGPAGHGAIATGNIIKCQEFWRTFVRSPVVMSWIEEGYHLLWTVSPPLRREFANAPSALEHIDFVSGAVEEMLAADVVTLLPPGEKPMVVSPLGVVPKRGTDKFRLTVNMRYNNKHLGKKAFKFEGPGGPGGPGGEGRLRGVLRPHVGVLQRRALPKRPALMSASSGEASTTYTTAFPLDSRRPLGSFQR
jgi:hypothetical protein